MSEFHVIPFLRDILRFYFPSPGPKMRLPIVFRPPHQQEISEENYQAKGGQEEKFDFCSGTLDTFQFQYSGDCDRQPEWQSFGMLIFVTGCSHKP